MADRHQACKLNTLIKNMTLITLAVTPVAVGVLLCIVAVLPHAFGIINHSDLRVSPVR
jgi:hypothetical protein